MTLLVIAGIVAVILPIRMVTRSVAPRPDVALSNMVLEEESVVERLAAAVRIPTVRAALEREAASSIRDLHDLLQEAFPLVNAGLEREVVGGGSLLYTWPASRPGVAPIVLAGRLDTPPPGSEDDWSRDPFSGVIEAGFVWGRGALLSKGPSIALLSAVEALIEEGFVPSRPVVLALAYGDEGVATGTAGPDGTQEVGAVALAQRLVDGGLAPEWLLTGGSGVQTELVPALSDPVALIGTAENGSVTLELVARRALDEAMAASPIELESAIGRVATAVTRLDERPSPAKISGPTRELLDVLGPRLDPATRMLVANLWLLQAPVARGLGESQGLGSAIRTTVIPIGFRASGPSAFGPMEAVATVRVGIAAWDTERDALARISESIAGLGVDLRTGEGRAWPPEPVPASSGSEGFRLLRRAAFRAFPDIVDAVPGTVDGPTDARHYSAVAVDVYRFTPIRLDRERIESVTGPDERIRVTEYLGMVRFYAELIREAAGTGE